MNDQDIQKLWAERQKRADQIRRINQMFIDAGFDPNYRGIGGDLEGDGAMIVAMGAMQAQAEDKSQG
jgi:hypothetical protein